MGPGEGSVFHIGRIIMTYLPRQRAFVLAGTLATLLVAAGPAAAQQQTPLPPGSPLIGQPDTQAAKKLAPVAPPPLPAAADKLPLDKLKAPKGFTIDVYASGVDNARTLRLGDKGTVFVSSRIKDKIHAIVDKDGKREVKVIASGLHRPNGIPRSIVSIWTAAGWKSLPPASARSWGWTGIRSQSSSTLLNTSATGCRKTFRKTNSTE